MVVVTVSPQIHGFGSMSIRENVPRILAYLAQQRDRMVDGAEIAENVGLEPNEVNDAVAVMVDNGLAKWERAFGTEPYDFVYVEITARGRYQAEG